MYPTRLLLTASMTAAAVSCTPAMGSRHETLPDPRAQVEQATSRAAAPHTSAAAGPITRRTGYATASDGARIYYEACGEGPPLVLIHGLGGNHAVWFNQVPHFAASHTVVTISQRGFAPSGGDQNHYDVERLARDLEATMDAAGVPSAVVVGQSMGGWTALVLALRSPARVQGLVLADTFGGIDDDEIAAHRREIAASAARLRNTPPPLGVHPALSAGFSRERPELGYLYQTLTTFGAPAADSIVRQLFATRVTSERLQQWKVPTLFIVGSGDMLFPPRLIEKAAKYVEGAEVVVVPEAGHSPYFEQPAAWNDAVGSFLARQSAPASD